MRRHDFAIKLADVRRSGLPPIFLRGSDKGAGEFVAGQGAGEGETAAFDGAAAVAQADRPCVHFAIASTS
jgi:hypothetical protein